MQRTPTGGNRSNQVSTSRTTSRTTQLANKFSPASPRRAAAPHTARSARHWLVGVAAFVLIALGLRVPYQTGTVTAFAPVFPCPERPRHTRPLAFHFQSSLEEHQSWLDAS